MNIKTGKWIVTAAAVPFLMGIGSTPSLKDMRFDVTSVGLSGPSTISNGGSANYSVSVNIQRTGAGPNDTIIGTAPNVPPPRIRPALYSGSTQLTFQEINFEPRQNSATVTLTLSCVNNEVRGPQAAVDMGAIIRFYGGLGMIRRRSRDT